MKMGKNNKIYIGIAASVLVLASIGVGVKMSNDKKVKEEAAYKLKINNKVKDISGVFLNLDVQKDDDKKLESLKKLISEKEAYGKGNEKDKKIIDSYDKTINSIKDYFKNKNNVTLNTNKIADLNADIKVDDLKSKVDSLNSLKLSIKKQENLIYSKDELSKLNKEIEDMEKSFSDKINEISKKEAEAKAAEEEKAKKQEALAKQAPADLSSVNTTSQYQSSATSGGDGSSEGNQAGAKQSSSYQQYQNNVQNTKPAQGQASGSQPAQVVTKGNQGDGPADRERYYLQDTDTRYYFHSDGNPKDGVTYTYEGKEGEPRKDQELGGIILKK